MNLVAKVRPNLPGRLLAPMGARFRDTVAPFSCRCVRLLLDHRAQIDRADHLGRTPLYAACAYGQDEAARVLIQAGANINAAVRKDPVLKRSYQFDAGHTPLFAACVKAHASCLTLLCEAKATLDLKGNRAGETALHLACGAATACNASNVEGHAACVQALIAAGAPLNAKSARGTPLAVACSRGETDCVALLLDAGAELASAGQNHPLVLACTPEPSLCGDDRLKVHLACVKLLLGSGCHFTESLLRSALRLVKEHTAMAEAAKARGAVPQVEHEVEAVQRTAVTAAAAAAARIAEMNLMDAKRVLERALRERGMWHG